MDDLAKKSIEHSEGRGSQKDRNLPPGPMDLRKKKDKKGYRHHETNEPDGQEQPDQPAPGQEFAGRRTTFK